jgi:glucan-binding YG repeat protein
MATGWQKIDGDYFFLKDNGVMASGEWCEGYWLNSDGTWTYPYKASWKQDSRGWWYGDTSGWYAKNCSVKIDGWEYAFDKDGYWIA